MDKNRSGRKQPRKFDLIQVQDLSGRVGGFQIGLAISQPLPRSSVDDVIDSVVTEAHQSAPAEPSSLPLSHMEDDAVRWSRLSSWDVYNYISHMHLDHHLGLMNIMQLRERAFISQDREVKKLYILNTNRMTFFLTYYHAKPILCNSELV